MLVLVGCALPGVPSALAQSTVAAAAWPTRTVRVVVPVAPGGGADIQARLFARKLAEGTGQSFIVDNRSGAGGVIGAEVVSKSPPDGYTLLFATASVAVNASLNKKTSLDAVRDLQVASVVSSSPLVFSVHPSMPARSVAEFVATARKRGGDLIGSSNGTGTTSHLALEMLNQMARLKLVHVPYKGGVPSMTALVGGQVDFGFTTVLTVQPFIKLGKVRVLAVTTARPASALPDLPTMASVFPDFEIDNWYAFFLPAGVPAAVVARVNEEAVRAVKSPEVSAYLRRDGGDPLGTGVEAANTHFRREVAKYAQVVAAGNVRAD